MRRVKRLLPFLALLAACSGGASVYVDRQMGLDGAWVAEGKEGVTRMDATGDTVTVRFRGRTFVIPGMKSCRGMVASEEVHLSGEGLAVDLTPLHARVRGPSGAVERSMADLPLDKEIVFAFGSLLYR